MKEEFSETVVKLQPICTFKLGCSTPGFYFTQELATVHYILGTSDQ